MPICRIFRTRTLLTLALLALGACAKTGEPQPPQVRVPMPAHDLAARQYSDTIRLTVALPVVNTNGSALTNLDRVELLRLAGSGAGESALPEDLFLSRARTVRVISTQELEKYKSDGNLLLEDQPAPLDPAEFFSSGFRYAVLFVNTKRQAAGLSNQIFIAPVPIPNAPEGLAATVSQSAVRLTWRVPERNLDGSSPARIAGFHVYRSDTRDIGAQSQQNKELIHVPEYEDRSFEFDRTYYYAVSVVGSTANPYAESFPSDPLALTPKDVFAPGVPRNFIAVAEQGVVTLMWGPPGDPDLAGYRIYRREEGSETPVLLQSDLVINLSFRDDKVRSGTIYVYSILAVDSHGNESRAATATVEVQ